MQAEIQTIVQRKAESLEISAQKVLETFAALAFTTLPGIVKYGQWEMSLEDFDNLTEAQKLCIKGFQATTEYELGPDGRSVPVRKVKVQLYDRLRALEALGKHLSLFNDGAAAQVPVQVVLNLQGSQPGPVPVEVVQPAQIGGPEPESGENVENAK